jgi:hypothetical protein
MEEYIGIDPGPRYTGVSVITDDKVVLSTTFKRPDDTPPITWAVEVAQRIMIEVISQWPNAKVGIEGVATPQAYNNGKKSLMNPKHLIHLGMTVGAIAALIPYAVVVRPGKNGSGSNYPEELTGRRPKSLAGQGVGTRNHERSAYDVAKQVERLTNEGYTLDMIKGLFDE